MKPIVTTFVVLLSYFWNCNAQCPAGAINCGFTTQIQTVTSLTGRIWMDRNLGASNVPATRADPTGFGDLYQWGRFPDGHQCLNSSVTSSQSPTDLTGHSNFITSGSGDWRDPQNDMLWQGLSGINNPCPCGFRVPTEAEWLAEIATWSSLDATGAFTSALALPLGGYRRDNNAGYNWQGGRGYYWSSTVDGSDAIALYFNLSGGSAGTTSKKRGRGYSVRCIQHLSLLPIELIYFKASQVESVVELNWVTASENNNDHFTVERSLNGTDWELIGTINGGGNSTSQLSYNLFDSRPILGVSYYRLKQTDFDGAYRYSDIRILTIENLPNQVFIYPNPASDEITIIGDRYELTDVRVLTVLGQDITKHTSISITGEKQVKIELSNLSTGFYIIKTKNTVNKVYKE
jgi:uncharacterized protein (TIGR02145 family)